MARAEMRNVHLAQSEIMGTAISFKWSALKRIPGRAGAKRRAKPKVSKTKPVGKFSEKARKTPESMVAPKGLSAAFNLLRNKETEDRQGEK